MCFYNGIVSTANTFRKAALNRKLNSTALEKESRAGRAETRQQRSARHVPGFCLSTSVLLAW